jgi:hypothetical protein
LLKLVAADYADENGFVTRTINNQLSTTSDFAMRTLFSSLKKRDASCPLSRPTPLAFYDEAEAWLIACEWRQEMRQQLIATELADNAG